MTDANARALAAARGWLGTPYVERQATRGAGADCLGLVRGVWAEVTGVWPPAAPRTPWPYADRQAVERDLRAALDLYLAPRIGPHRPGDVLLVALRPADAALHLAIAEDGRRVISASSGRCVVRMGLPRTWQVRAAWGWEALDG